MAGRVAGVLVGIFFGVVAHPAAAQSLADVARQEAARRQQGSSTGPAAKVLTNADLPASAVVSPAGTAAATADGQAAGAAGADDAAPAAEGTAAAPAPETGAAAPTPAAGPTDDEAGWRARAGRVNAALAAAESQLRQLKALSDRLSLEAQASNPAIAARAQAERGQLRAQIAQAEEKAAEAQAQHAALGHESRTAGVPPAWVQ